MRRYIDADLIQYEPMLRPQGNGNYEDCEIAYRDEIDNIPTADVRENVRGEWILHIDDLFPEESTMECNQCHEHQPVTIDDNFCPNCGAQMIRGKA